MTRRPKVKGGPANPVWFTGQENDVRVVSVVDEYGGLVVLPWTHWLIHQGLMFQVDYYNASVGNNGTLILGTPDPFGIEGHIAYNIQAGGDATIELLEDSNPTGGVARQARNMNRSVADGINFLTDPALAGGAVISGPILLPAGRGPQAGGGSVGARPDLEWECDEAMFYALRLTNISGVAQALSIVANYYAQ